jgi:hypothetical protein
VVIDNRWLFQNEFLVHFLFPGLKSAPACKTSQQDIQYAVFRLKYVGVFAFGLVSARWRWPPLGAIKW